MTVRTQQSRRTSPVVADEQRFASPVVTAVTLLLITAAILLIYTPALHHDFVSYDDGDYVYENKMVQKGITWETVKWAFTQSHAANWHPLTWLSHATDWQLYGNKPGRHHFTSVLFHIANTLLLFLLFRRMAAHFSAPRNGSNTSSPFWIAASVAALFALHPLHVESVAWLAERKDVLSTFFGLLSLIAYIGYVERKQTLNSQRSTLNYCLCLLLFACSLMSKPMLVTFPFVLLLLDFWPLGRLAGVLTLAPTAGIRRAAGLMLEKFPFLVLSVTSSVVTLNVQRGKTIQSLANFSVLDRICNVLVSYVVYLWNMIWPAKLAFFYPLVSAPPLWQAGLAFGFLAGLTVIVLKFSTRFPWAVTGWFWYLGTLVPVIGLVHVGEQSHADRYTYIPLIGIFIVITCAGAELARRKRVPAMIVGAAAAAVLVACSIVSARQVGYWKDNRAMLERALAVTDQNFLAHNNYGVFLADEAQKLEPRKREQAVAMYDEAIRHYEQAIQWKPTYARAYDNWGAALTFKGQFPEAIEKYETALKLNPFEARTHHNLAVTFARLGKYQDTIDQCREALKVNSKYYVARFDLGLALSLTGKRDEAIQEFRAYLRSAPDDAAAHFHLGSALLKRGELAAGIGHLRQSVRLDADFSPAHGALAWVLATAPDAAFRDGAEAVRMAERAVELTHRQHGYSLAALAAAYAETGRFEQAVETAEAALTLAEKSSRKELVADLHRQMDCYRARQPFRQSGQQ